MSATYIVLLVFLVLAAGLVVGVLSGAEESDRPGKQQSSLPGWLIMMGSIIVLSAVLLLGLLIVEALI